MIPRLVAAGDVDVVDAGAGAADHLQPLGAVDQLRRSAWWPSGSGSRRTRRSARSSSSSASRGRARRRSCSRSRSTPVSAIFSLTRTFDLSVAHRLTSSDVLDHPVDAGGERLDVGGLDRREHADPQLVAAELAVGLDVDDAVGAQRRGERGGVDRVVEVDRADDQRALGRIGDERGGELAAPRPSRRGGSTRRGCAPTHQLEAAARRASTRSGRRAGSGSRARACCRSGPCASSRAPSSARGTRGCQRSSAPSSSLDPLDRRRAQQRQPEAAVGAEGLLRREVVGVGLRRRRPAGRRRRRSRRSGPARRRRPPGARPATMTPVEVSLWAQAITSASGSADRSRARRPARPRSRSGRRGTARRRSPWRTCDENSP